MKISDRKIVSNMYDILFLCFPLWIPILFLLLFTYAKGTAVIFLLALFVLAEAHFGITWLFFLDPNNKKFITTHPAVFFIFPTVILFITSLVFFLISPAAALVLASIASAFHVTRQSIGINKMFGIKGHKIVQLSNFAIYTLSAFFLAIGFLRFFANITISTSLLQTVQILGGILLLISILFILTRKESKDLSLKFHLTTITGMIIYAPFLFVARPEYASVMGVGMHWLQYLALVSPIYLRKQNDKNITKDPILSTITKKWVTLGIYVFLYAGIMVFLRQYGMGFQTFEYSTLIIIPLSFQMLHFYYEAFIWKFSDPHIRKEVGTYIFGQPPQVLKPSPT